MTDWTNIIKHASPDVIKLNADIIDAPRKPQRAQTATKAEKAPTEHAEQVSLFAALEFHVAEHPELRLAFAIPNGGFRHKRTAAMLQREGVKAGVPDIMLPVPRGNYHGLFVELKRANRQNHATTNQRQWLDDLAAQGYATAICYGADEALGVFLRYVEASLP